jgi:HK97 family phage major capsid protein
MMKTPGEQITGTLLEHPERRRFNVNVGRKAVTPILTYPSTAETVDRVIPGPVLPLRLRSLITPGQTVGSGILYARETSFTSSTIVPVNPGALKGAADLSYEIVQQPVITIPAYLKLPKQYWEDFVMLESWMNSRLLYGLSDAEENQLLNGNGIAPNLQGLMAVAMAVTPGAAGLLNGVAAGIAAVYGRGYLVTGIVVNPADWGKILTTLGTPALMGPSMTLWGIPVVISKWMTALNYLVGQFNPYSQIFDREEAAVEIADQDQDDFIRNLVAIRAEERLALAVYQPGAFAKGTFT